jgi:hypothetical protein
MFGPRVAEEEFGLKVLRQRIFFATDELEALCASVQAAKRRVSAAGRDAR